MIEQDTKSPTLEFRPASESEPAWSYEMRKQAWDQYSTMPLPDRVQHLWKYTAPEQFEPELVEEVMKVVPVRPNGHSRTEQMLPDGHDGIGVQTSDSKFGIALSSSAAKKGVTLLSLADAMEQQPDLLKKHLGSVVGAAFGKFEALNLALWQGGLFLHVPAHTTLEQPIHLKRMPGVGTTITRLLIVVGENSEVSIIDEYAGGEGEGLTHAVVEGIVEPSARVALTSLFNLSKGHRLNLTHRNRIGENVTLTSSAVALGGSVTKVNWSTQLAGRGANSHWNGLLLGNGKQHFDHFTGHHHSASETFSNLEFKVAAGGKAVSAYTGRINIDKDAFFCEAYQENRNLLLSDKAKVESIPELEIINDEVKCSHGVTVGALEDEQIFYLMARGISRDEAMRIILTGFFEKSLETLPEVLRETTREQLLAKLEV